MDDRQLKENQQKSLRKAFKLAAVVLLAGLGLAISLIFMESLPSEEGTPKGGTSQEGTTQSPQTSSFPSQENVSITREEVKAEVAKLEQDIEFIRSDAALFAWQPAQVSQFEQKLDSIYLEYATDNYGALQNDIDTLAQSLIDYRNDYKNTYLRLYEEAALAFEKGAINQAKLLNTQSLEINPSYEKGLTLQQRIEVFPKVKALERDMQQARSEKDIVRESELISSILALENDRPQLRQRYKELSELIREQEFNQAIQRANQALNNQDLAQASQLFEHAKTLMPQRPELQVLSEKISDYKRVKEVASLKANLIQLQSEEDWSAVREIAAQASLAHPSESEFSVFQNIAEQILTAQKIFGRYLEEPIRVFDKNIRATAKQDLEDMKVLNGRSARLNRMMEQVSELVDTAHTPVALKLNSDGNTDIRVLRVGVVGKTMGREIDLLPGPYQLEGRCLGFKTVKKDVFVMPNQLNELTIVCDEKIN